MLALGKQFKNEPMVHHWHFTRPVHTHHDRASIVVAGSITGCSEKGNSQSLVLKCVRQNPMINPGIQDVYDAIIADEAEVLLSKRRTCTINQHLGNCANIFLRLAECSCPELSRTRLPELRLRFEKLVNSRAINDIIIQGDIFEYTMAIYDPGRLFGEFVIMIKLFEQLRIYGCQGKIRLMLIDTAYQGSINKFINLSSASFQNSSWENFFTHQNMQEIDLQHGKALVEFMRLLSFCIPRGIELEVNVFGSVEHYKTFSRSNPSLKHNLLIASDIGNTDANWPKVRDLAKNTRKQGGHGVALVSTDAGPKIRKW